MCYLSVCTVVRLREPRVSYLRRRTFSFQSRLMEEEDSRVNPDFYLRVVEESLLGRTPGLLHSSELQARVCCGEGRLKSLGYVSLGSLFTSQDVFLSAWADCVSLQTVCATCLCVLLLGYVDWVFYLHHRMFSFQRGLTVSLQTVCATCLCVLFLFFRNCIFFSSSVLVKICV